MWKTVKIGNVAEVKAGNSAPQDKSLFEGGTHPFVRTSDVGKIKIGTLTDSNDKLNEKGIAKLNPYKRGTILFPKSGASTFLNHRVKLNIDAYVSSHLATIKSKLEEVTDEYLWYFLQTIDAAQLVADSSYPSLNIKTIQSIPVPLPPLAEQQRIVAKLDAAFAEIDEASEKIIKARDPIAQLYINFLRNELRDSSYDWHTEELGNIAENLDSVRVPITKSNRTQGSIPYYGASGIVDYVDGYLFNEDLLLISEDGANLLMRTYPIAFSVSGKTWVNNHAHVLKFADKEIQYWVEQYLNITNLSEFITGMAQPKLNQKKLNSIPIPIPSKKKRLRDLIETIKVLKMRADCLNDTFIKKEAQLLKLKSAILVQELQSKKAA